MGLGRANDSRLAGANSASWWTAILLGLIAVLAAVARLRGLDTLSVWYDEGWTLYLTRSDPAELLRQVARYADPHPPGYYMLLLPWMRLWGHNAVAARSFSALVGVATIPAVYWLGRQLFDRATGLTAAGLLALAPAHIAYSQEARMYTLLGLCAALLWALHYRYVHERGSWGRWAWVALVVVQSLALYTHFFAALVVLALATWALVALAWQTRRAGWRPLAAWLAAQLVVALTLAPWLPVIVQRAGGHITASTYTPPLPTFALESWSFLLAGQIDLLAPNPLYAALAAGAAALIAAGVAWALWRGLGRRAAAYLAFQMACTALGVYLLMLLRPGFHPRYLFMLLPALVTCVAHLIASLARGRMPARIGAAVLLLVWLTANLEGGRLAAATNPWRDDARSAVAYLRENLPQGSVVVAAYTAWELDYYLEGGGLIAHYYGQADFEREAIDGLAALARNAPQVAYVRWRQSDTDHTGQIAYTLAREGRLIAERRFPAYDISIYEISPARPAPRSLAVQARFGPLTLGDAEVAQDVAADGALTVILRWRLEGPVAGDLKAALTLIDARGRTLAQQDRFLQDARGLGTSRWQPGQAGATYHTLALAPGIAPLAYRLQVAVYHEGDLRGLDVLDAAGVPAGKAAVIGAVELAPAAARGEPRAPDRAALGLTAITSAEPSPPSLMLAAYRLERRVVYTGQRLTALLEWRNASGGPLPDLRPVLRVVRDGIVLAQEASAPVYGAYPTTRWAPNEVVLEWRDLLVPADAASGPALLDILVPGQRPATLGAVEIRAVARSFERPRMQHKVELALGEIALLTGYDLSAIEVAFGDDLTVTLCWQALAPSGPDLTVFVHLLDRDGRLIAQHDGMPAHGERPTPGWLAGEFILDEHTLHWLDLSYTGPASLHVGLYDSDSGERLLAPWGASSLSLPSSITVR